MADQYVLGIDLGTTAIKVGIFDDQGKKVTTCTQEYTLITPQEGWVEQRADVYWDAFLKAVQQVVQSSDIDPKHLIALSISAQGETMFFLDENMQPLYNGIVWMDTRAQEEAEEINEWFDADTILKNTGQGPITSLYPACKVRWMQKHHPEIFNRVSKVLLLEDYFFYRLCGRCVGEGSLWCTSYMWNIATKCWWPEMLERLSVTKEQLPEILESTTRVGRLSAEIAEELGLPEGMHLIMGGLDQACGAIGVGNVHPGVFSECTGAALVVATMTDKIVLDRGGELPCFYGAVPGTYMLHAGAKGGIILRWLRDTLCREEIATQEAGGPNAYAQMDALAKQIPAGSDGLTVLPYWGGAGAPDTNQYVHGMIYGLGLQHTKGHLVRAFMEAIAINIRRMVEYTETVTGSPVTEIRTLGGGSTSDIWNQIKADALGRPVIAMKNTQDASCLGAAILAGVGSGLWSSVEEITERATEVLKVYAPNPDNRMAYDDLAKRYALLAHSVTSISKQI